MMCKVKLKDHVRVSPENFGEDLNEILIEEIRDQYSGYISEEIGIVIDVSGISEVGEGIIVPGDGARYYETVFELLTFEPKTKEVLWGKVRDVADFGAFLNLGPIDGMVHISQTMNDYVSFSKEKILQGKDSNKTLKIGDDCKAKMIAVSYKDITNPKLGLTMRQDGLGKKEWLEEDSGGKKSKKKDKSKKKKKSKKKSKSKDKKSKKSKKDEKDKKSKSKDKKSKDEDKESKKEEKSKSKKSGKKKSKKKDKKSKKKKEEKED